MYLRPDQFATVSDSDRSALFASLQSGELSHAYLLLGSDNNDLDSCAYELLSCAFADNSADAERMEKRLRSRLHADVLDIFPEGASVKLSQVRLLKEFLIKEPLEGDMRVGLIHSADKLTNEAQNALLTTLEEPLGGAMTLLLSASLEAILPTIRSRTVHISLTGRSVGAADEKIRAYTAEKMNELVLEGSVTAILDTANALSLSGTEKNAKPERAAAIKNVNYVLAFFTQLLFYQSAGTLSDYSEEELRALSGKLSGQCLIKIIDLIKASIEDLTRNASIRLCCEAMLIRIWEECNAENSWNKI